jgi:hypothetical protein
VTWDYYNIKKEDAKATDEEVMREIRESFGAFNKKVGRILIAIQALKHDPDMKPIISQMEKIAPKTAKRVLDSVDKVERVVSENLTVDNLFDYDTLRDVILGYEPHYDNEFSQYRTKRTGSKY